MNYKNLTEVLLDRARTYSNYGITFIESSSNEEKINYTELYNSSLKVLYNLQQKGLVTGDEVVMQFDNNKNFIITFWACVLGGFIPVGLNVVRNQEQALKTINVWKFLKKPFMASSAQNIDKLENTFGQSEFINSIKGRIFIDTDLFEGNELGVIYYPKEDDLAYIQFSSGSTGAPKGVMLTHKNLIANTTSILKGIKSPVEGDTFLSWMPLTHDMGLIGMHISPTVAGFDHFLMPTDLFIRRPSLWLQKISEYRLTFTASPNFGYRYVLDRLDIEIAKNFDLSSLRAITNGAEPISYDLCIEFAEKLGKYGLKSNVIFPVYGLAEASLAVTFSEPEDEIQKIVISRNSLNAGDSVQAVNSTDEGITFVNVGKPIEKCDVKIVHNQQIVKEDIIGAVFIKGDNVTSGYYNNEKATNEIIDKEGWLNTGDLGFINRGSLFITGRAKDIIFINGQNYYPHDIERCAEEVEGIELGKIAVAGYFNDNVQKEEVIAFVLNKGKLENFISIVIDLKKHILQHIGFEISKVVQVKEIPKTTSGKIQRFKLIENYKQGFYNEVCDRIDKMILDKNRSEYQAPQSEIEEKLVKIWQEVLGLEKVGVNDDFFRIGGTSVRGIQLQQQLKQIDEFKHIIAADLFKYNTINKLVKSIQQGKEAEYKLQNIITQSSNHEIAIIGVSGAFPSADNIEELWQLIANQKEGIKFYSKDECKQSGVDESLLENPDYIPTTGRVKDIDLFDPLFWGISPNEAKQFDPQIRKFIEHCWFALESAGYIHQRKEHQIGVFAGSGDSDYFHKHILNGEIADQINVWDISYSNNKDALATKVAYMLGLSGLANSINTACSTGLVSVVEACKNLQLGTCDMALAGGVSLYMPDNVGYVYKKDTVFSKDGHCKTFDKEASGTIFSSGVAVVLLKRLEDAIKDNDHILAVIKGYATNNDGDRKAGYTAPSVIGQSECIINAHRMAAIPADQIDYVECHGTATSLGDSIEIQALRKAFEYDQPKDKNPSHKIVLGALKANIGHTVSAAGVAGLIKVCSMLNNNTIPGQVNFNTLNPELYLDQTNFEIIKENREWLTNQEKPRLAGVSSFGLGGTNAHVIVGDYIPKTQNQDKIGEGNQISFNKQDNNIPYVIPVSANSRRSLENYKQALIKYLTNAIEKKHSINIRDISYTLQEKREPFNYRSAYCARNIDELIGKLGKDTLFAQIDAEGNNNVVFMFPGQGGQYIHMAKELYDNELFFRNTIDHCISLANQHLAANLYDVIYPREELSPYDINEIEWSAISLFVIEYSLAKFLEHLGVEADAYIGHSFGEYVAATLSGVFALEDAIKVVIARGRLIQSMQSGSMLAINAKEESIKTIIYDHNCEISVINSPEDIVASGFDKDITALKEALDKQNIPTVKLNSTSAGHSKLMEQASLEFEWAFEGCKMNEPIKYFASNLSGKIAREEVTAARYWCEQLRNTVQFAMGIDSLSQLFNHRVSFIEVGAGKGLSSFVNKYKTANGHSQIRTLQLLPSKSELKNEDKAYLNVEYKEDVKAKLWISGIIQKPNEISLFKDARLQTCLPLYQFDYQKCWIDKSDRQNVKKFNPIDDMFYERSWERINSRISSIGIGNIRHKNILVLVNDNNLEQSGSEELLTLLSGNCDNTNYVIHQQGNNIKPDFKFDFSDAEHIKTIFNEKVRINPIDIVIYISPCTDINNPSLDIFAVRNIFDWSKETDKRIPKFISISFDNYEVFGNEQLQEKPSIIYGVTKSIPYDYFILGTKVLHIDLSLQDNYKDTLLPILGQNTEKELIVLRGKYQWVPNYQQVKLPNNQAIAGSGVETNAPVFLITGGLGSLGYAYANYATQKYEKCTIILLGRSKESALREDYKARLENLKKTKHHIIYSSIDISQKGTTTDIEKLLASNNIGTIDLILHAAGVVPKSILNEKKHDDIEVVVNPKIVGVENLIKIADCIPVNNLINCSSVSSILPFLGNLEYTAANLYLDEICHRSNPNIKYMITINLNFISDTEMAFDLMKSSISKSRAMLNSIQSKDFPGIIEKLLQSKVTHNVILSRFDFNSEISEHTKVFSAQDIKPKSENKIQIFEDDYTETEYKIAQIFGDILGIEQISIHDDFFKMGGNSILAIRVSHQISSTFGCEIRVADLFKNKTVNRIKEIVLSDKKEDAAEMEIVRI